MSRPGFESQELNENASFGDLATRRLSRGLTVNEVAIAIRVSVSHVFAIEEGRFEDLPGSIYARQYIKSYADLMDLDANELLEAYSIKTKVVNEKQEKFLKSLPTGATRHVAPGVMIRRFFIFGGLILAGTILLWQAISIIIAPKLDISSPEPRLVTASKEIEVHGVTVSGARATINGQPVLVDENGAFSKHVTLSGGVNILRIEARTRYSRTAVLERQIFVRP